MKNLTREIKELEDAERTEHQASNGSLEISQGIQSTLIQSRLKREKLWKMKALVKEVWQSTTGIHIPWNVIPAQLPEFKPCNTILLESTDLPNFDEHEIVHNFYQRLFTPEREGDITEMKIFLTEHSLLHLKITEAHKVDLIKPITGNEASKALETCMNRKAPGFDSTSFEYYKMILPLIVEPFAEQQPYAMQKTR